jgi:hypothetical protein
MPGRYYTTPFTSAGPNVAIASSTLYAIPAPIACAVTVTQLSAYETSSGSASACRLGIYGDNGSGQPGPLILDAGTVPILAGPPTAVAQSVSQQLAPGLVFLVAGCNGTLTLQSGSVTGTLLGSLIGLGARTDTNAVMESTGWSFGALPPAFPGATYATSPGSTLAPLVFLRP